MDLAWRAAALSGTGQFFFNLRRAEKSGLIPQEWLSAASGRVRSDHLHEIVNKAPPESSVLRDYVPRFFGKEDFAALQAFTEILIPTDDTPGAREARCAHFIDFVLAASSEYAPATQVEWRRAMLALRNTGFHSAADEQRLALVTAISEPDHNPEAKHPAYFAYRLIKRENAFAFYTSRAGMIDALDYRGNSYNSVFPACEHPEHHVI